MENPQKRALAFVALSTLVLLYQNKLYKNNSSVPYGREMVTTRLPLDDTDNSLAMVPLDDTDNSLAKMDSKRKEEELGTTIYGLIHIAKTGGSNTNGLLASKYDNVCGNKGHSFNSFVVQKDRKDKKDQEQQRSKKPKQREMLKAWNSVKIDESKNAIGFENCDYIALENRHSAWVKDVFDHMDFKARNFTLELHLPCRDSLEHAMSQCNHLKRKFKCPDADGGENLAIEKEVRKCVKPLNTRARFNPKLKEERGDQIQIRCFQPFPSLDAYVDYMGNYLRRRKIEVEYVNMPTNKNRTKTKECIWDQSKEYQDTVREIIRKLDKTGYYEFCDSCIGSSDELMLSPSSSS